MRVILADDSTLFRRGLAALLAATEIDVVAEAACVDELVTVTDHHRPDAVIIDVRMPPTNTDDGLRAAETLRSRHPDLGLLVLSAFNETAYAVRLLEDVGGGVGYLLKDRVDDIATLVEGLRRVCTGRSIIDSEIVDRLITRRTRVDELTMLSAREREVLEHMAAGRSNASIGHALGLTARSVEAHVNGVFTKFGLPRDTDDNRQVLAVLTWMRTNPP